MDKNKQQIKRGPKLKPLPPPGDFIVLGSKTQKSSSDSGLLEMKLGPGSSKSSSRDQLTTLASGQLSKKPKLSSSVHSESSTRSQGVTWESIAIEVDPNHLVNEVMTAENGGDDEKAEKLLCGCAKLIRSTRSKPDPSLFIGLLFLAKTRPGLFCSNLVTEAFCSLLRRDLNVSSFKVKGNPLISTLAANILLAAYHDDENWPDTFFKIYWDDALGERLWVDQDDCKGFVDNIVTVFNTKLTPKELLPPELVFKPDVSSSPPASSSMDQDVDSSESNIIGADSKKTQSLEVPIFPRYLRSVDAIHTFVIDVVREQLNRRQPMDNVSRNVLRVLATTCGLDEVRLLVSQKLEMWMQNPKLTRYAQELLLAVCLNCREHNKQDIDVIGQLIKIRLKTKPLVNHYLLCIRELLNQHPDNLTTVLKHTIYNELSTSRNPNNMGLIGIIFQHSPEQAPKLEFEKLLCKQYDWICGRGTMESGLFHQTIFNFANVVLAETFQDVLNNREDYLRAIRGLYREIVRTLRHDMNFTTFCLGLMTERKEPNFKDMDTSIRDRLFAAITDLITLSIFLGITPAVKDVALSRVERKEISPLRSYQKQVAEIQRDSIWWLHNVALKAFKPAKSEFVHCLQKVLFMEQPEHYYSKDNWPQESDRMLMLRLASEVPLLEDTLLWILLIGLSKDHPLNPSEALELVDQVVKRVALLHADDFHVLEVQRIHLINIVFNLCAYHHPENISLPHSYQPPSLAITSLYWKAWILLLIVTAHNPLSFGVVAWENYPTLRYFMEMCITNHFSFPLPTIAFGEKAEDLKVKELQICQLEKQEILEFENHLAAASSKVVITETNSLLLAQLTSMDPSGVYRRPPTHILEQLKSINSSLKLGHLLCRTRNPDFLLDIIQRQSASQSMPWLANLVESSEGSFDVLPVQCLCEFLLNEQLDVAQGFTVSSNDVGNNKEETKAEKVEKVRQMEKKRKQKQLLKHLQEVLFSQTHHSQQTIEILDYFLRRLGSSQTIARCQALRCLSLVLSLSTKTGDDDEDDVAIINNETVDENKNAWLLQHLPSLPHFETVRYQTSLAVRQACQVENDPMSMIGYIHFLASYAMDDQLQELADLALDVAHVIVQRTTIINYLLPFGAQSTSDSDLLLAFLIIFIKYLRKAREPSKEAYSWSESQDQILVQWSTGEAATMHVLVVHAMIVLLTYGPPTDSTLFDELLEVWFPSDVDPPQAYLVDTSEEALLYPDWLKLRMIRSSVEVLVDAALKDLEPAQLVLFIQSFGIPIQSISKLLRALDAAVEYDSYTVESVVVDKVYMAHLVEVQQQRGAKFGVQFASFLGLLGEGNSSMDETGDDLKTTTSSSDSTPSVFARQTPPVIVNSQRIYKVAVEMPSLCERDVPLRVAQLFGLDAVRPVLSQLERHNLLRSLQKSLASEARQQTLDKPFSRQLVHFFLNALDSSDAPFFVDVLVTHYVSSCPIFRLLFASCSKHGVISNPLTLSLQTVCQKLMVTWASLKKPETPLITIIKPMVANTSVAAVSVSGSKDHTADDLDHDSIIRAIEQVVSTDPTRIEELVHSLVKKAMARGITDNVISAFTTMLIGDRESATKMKNHRRESFNGYFGLLVDWLELLEPEIIQTSRELQQKLLFHKRLAVIPESVTSICPNLCRQSDDDDKKSVSIYNTCRPYLLATLIHQANWKTLRRCIGLLLVEESIDTEEYDPTTVLDFLFACVYIPKIWQGRDKHIPKHCDEEDVLCLSELQILSLARYIMSEVAISSQDVSYKERVWSAVEGRMPLLLRCCAQRLLVVKALVMYLVKVIEADNKTSELAHVLLLHTYLQIPRLIKYVTNKQVIFENASYTVDTPSQLDAMSHTLLTSLSIADKIRDWKDKIQDVDLACRKLASSHPVLMLRQLPMIAVTLRGRNSVELSGHGVVRQHIGFFSRVLGILELLQPFLFENEYSASFDVVCESYFVLIENYGLQQKEIGQLVNRFLLLLLSFVSADTQRAVRCIQKRASVLSELPAAYPENQSLRSILSIISLPKPMVDGTMNVATVEESGRESSNLLLSFTPPQQPPMWTPGQLTSIASRLASRESIEDVAAALHDLDGLSHRKVAVLENFTDEIKRILSHTSENCRRLAQNLMMRYLKRYPSSSEDFLDAFLACFESDRYDVIMSALERLAEFVLVCQGHAKLLLLRVFEVHMTTNINVLPYIGEVIQLLNVQGGS